MPHSRLGGVSLSVTVALLCAVSDTAHAQADLEGRVIAAGDKIPVAGARVQVPAAGRTATSDSGGRFVLSNLPAGTQLVVIRAPGFRPDSVKVMIPAEQILVRFIDRDMLAKVEHRTMSTILATMPGMAVLPGTGMKAWAYTTRAVSGSACAFCGPSSNFAPEDGAAGAKAGFCYMDVMVDGALVYRHDQPAPAQLYDLNSIPADQLEGIEVFTSTAQMPAQYNRTGSSCGLLVIWTRISK